MPAPRSPDTTVPAANADVLGDDARTDRRMPADLVDADDDPRGEAAQEAREGRGARDAGEARPGQDENQAGFVKDRDAADRPGG